jgi:glycosyltransferase involved in cell wall biosynthesis
LIDLHRWADVVYQNNIELGSLWPRLWIPRPTVISVRTWIRGNDGRLRWVHRLKKWVLRHVDAVIAISEAIRRDSVEQAVVIGNPYRSGLFRVIPEIPRENSVAFLGRLVSDKGADLLIRAFAEVKSSYEQLTLIGTGPEEGALRRLAEQRGVAVNFKGPLVGEELVRELNRHEILAIPSLWAEPFGNVALEGMACGCVVVGSNDGGLPDAIGSAGLLFERGSARALSESLRHLCEHPTLKESLRAQSKRHLEKHREEVVASRYLGILMEAATR